MFSMKSINGIPREQTDPLGDCKVFSLLEHAKGEKYWRTIGLKDRKDAFAIEGENIIWVYFEKNKFHFETFTGCDAKNVDIRSLEPIGSNDFHVLMAEGLVGNDVLLNHVKSVLTK